MRSEFGGSLELSEVTAPHQLGDFDITYWAIIQHNPIGEKNWVTKIFCKRSHSDHCLELTLGNFGSQGTVIRLHDELWDVHVVQFAVSPDGWLISLKRKAPNSDERHTLPEGVNEFTITNMHQIRYAS